MKEQIPFLCLKYIPDGADGKAAGDWTVQVNHVAAAFKKIICDFNQHSAIAGIVSYNHSWQLTIRVCQTILTCTAFANE